VGTATLLEALAKRPVARLVVASSMSIYGEGLCRDDSKRLVYPAERSTQQLRSARWELEDANGQALTPVPTPESKPPSLSSVYALNKYAQERLCLMVGKSYGIPTAALRFFNVYGPRQALSNPYTGVLAIFAARLLNGRSPMVFEDGQQRRDFVHVLDVANACRRSRRTGYRRARKPGTGGMSTDTLNRPILITGGCGFIGCNLADALAMRGDKVVVFDNLSRAGVRENAQWLKLRHGELVSIMTGDIRDAISVIEAVRGARAVLHLAAQVAVTGSLQEPIDDFEINARGTLNVLEAIRIHNPSAPMIFASTNKVYGRLVQD